MSSKLNDFADQELKVLDSKKLMKITLLLALKYFPKKMLKKLRLNGEFTQKSLNFLQEI